MLPSPRPHEARHHATRISRVSSWRAEPAPDLLPLERRVLLSAAFVGLPLPQLRAGEVVAADFDGDQDVAVTSDLMDAPSLTILRNDGNGALTLWQQFSPGVAASRNVAAVDFDHDGAPGPSTRCGAPAWRSATRR